MPATEAKTKKAQPSRKGKKAWRKNIDIGDVEESQETMRVEQRVRGTTEPASVDSLFQIDTTADTKTRKQLAKKKPLWVDEILNSRSAVPAVGGQKTLTKDKRSKSEAQRIERLLKKRLQNTDTTLAKTAEPTTYDLWATEEPEKGKDQNVKAPATLAQKPLAAVHQPAVNIPYAGASYNPSQEEHQNLLRMAHEIEVEKAAAIKKLEEQLEVCKALESLPEEEDSEKEAEDEGEAADNDDTKEEADEEDLAEKSTSKTGKRKTRAQRNKKKRSKAQQVLQLDKAKQKAIQEEIGKSRKIIAELDARQEELAISIERRQEKKLEGLKQGLTRLGKKQRKEMPIEIQLEDELSESLRQLKPEGNLFLDRFNSLQKRNIIEPREPVTKRRKYKLKEYEKPSHKAFDIAEKRKRQAAQR